MTKKHVDVLFCLHAVNKILIILPIFVGLTKGHFSNTFVHGFDKKEIMITIDCTTVHSPAYVVKEPCLTSPSHIPLCSETKSLEYIGCVDVPGNTKWFDASKVFDVRNKTVRFGSEVDIIGSDFKEWFIKGSRPVAPFPASRLQVFRLKEDKSIPFLRNQLRAFGVWENIQTTIAKIYLKMLQQPNAVISSDWKIVGPAGDLLTNGLGNLFFVNDLSGVPRVVCNSFRNGWGIGVMEIELRGVWKKGSKLFVPA